MTFLEKYDFYRIKKTFNVKNLTFFKNVTQLDFDLMSPFHD